MKKSVIALISLIVAFLSAARELPLPQIPDSISGPQQRADFVTLHFWDALDFTSADGSDDTFLEQNFSNFIFLLPHASDSGRIAAADSLFMKASASPTAYNKIIGLAGQYLIDVASPFYNNESYVSLLEGAVHYPPADEAQRIRLQAMLADFRKNPIGERPADIPLLLPTGTETTLLTLAQGKPAAVFFYDPECDSCLEAIGEMNSSEQLKALLESGEMRLIALATASDSEVWHAFIPSLPELWINAFDLSQAVDEGIYPLPAVPMVYLLDAESRVIARNLLPLTWLRTINNCANRRDISGSSVL